MELETLCVAMPERSTLKLAGATHFIHKMTIGSVDDPGMLFVEVWHNEHLLGVFHQPLGVWWDDRPEPDGNPDA